MLQEYAKEVVGRGGVASSSSSSSSSSNSSSSCGSGSGTGSSTVDNINPALPRIRNMQ